MGMCYFLHIHTQSILTGNILDKRERHDYTSPPKKNRRVQIKKRIRKTDFKKRKKNTNAKQ